MKFGSKLPERKKVIAQSSKRPLGKTWQVAIAGKQENLDIFTVSLDLPKYRINNGRTFSAQAEYIADKGCRDDHFSRDHESTVIQKIQHELLRDKIKNSDAVNIISNFKKEKQTQPLILTYDGFVLNGNRRLTAMREVYYSDKTKYRHFSNIEVIALPSSLDEKGLQEIEAGLQLKKEWKQDYSWIDESLIYKNQTELGLTPSDIAARDGVKVKDVVETIGILSEVDQYLSWIGHPKKYSLVSKSQHNFRLILKNWDKLKRPGEREFLRNLTFQLTKNDHEGRTYGLIPHIPKAMPLLVTDVAKDLGKSPADLVALNSAVRAKAKKIGEAIVETTINTIERFKHKNKKTKKDEAFIKAVRAANQDLTDAITFRDKNSKLEGLSELLKQIEASIKVIKKRK